MFDEAHAFAFTLLARKFDAEYTRSAKFRIITHEIQMLDQKMSACFSESMSLAALGEAGDSDAATSPDTSPCRQSQSFRKKTPTGVVALASVSEMSAEL